MDGEQGPNLTRLTSIFMVHTMIWIGATSLLHFGLGWVRNRDLERRRLELLYPNRHQLDIRDERSRFEVRLILDASESLSS